LVGLFRGGVPNKLLGILEQTLEYVPPIANVGEALSRHTWFARVFEIARTDTQVKWWTGSRTFLGTTPPARLLAWPKQRRVRVEATERPLVELPASAAAVDRERFTRVLLRFLAKTPLTDVATLDRVDPAFTWTSETLSLVGSRAGRTLVVRALRGVATEAVYTALGRATHALLAARALGPAQAALAVLAEQVLADAQLAVTRGDASSASAHAGAGIEATTAKSEEAALARALGALVALAELEARAQAYSPAERAAIAAHLAPLARSRHAAMASALLR
jgi:hypothetical protein